MDNLLQGIGIFICVGAIILAALVFFVFRAITNAGNRARGTGPNRDWQEPGPERPRVDDPNVQSSGGFGGTGIPTTGEQRQGFGPGRDLDDDFIPDSDRGLHRDRDIDLNIDRDRDSRRERRDDDDDVRSSGGFGS